MKSNIKYIYVLALVVMGLGMTACSDGNDTLNADTSRVTAAPDYVDARDGHTYRCVRIGDQIWMAENLAYFLPEGAAGGCITWDEVQSDFTLEDLAVDTASIVVTIDDDEYAELYMATVNDPDHNWTEEIGVNTVRLTMYLTNFYSMYGQEAFTEMMNYWPAFYSELTARLDAVREEQRDAYVAALVAEKAQIPIDHRDAAEAANGGYVDTYGYLYTLDGALAAVPEEDGWRLPSDEDWKKLETTLGMSAAEADKMNAWRGAGLGDGLKTDGAVGFNAIMAGCNAYQRTNVELFIKKDECAYFWASDRGTMTQEEESDDSDGEGGTTIVTYETGVIRQLAIYSSSIWRGTTRLDNKYRGIAYSVRLVKDAE